MTSLPFPSLETLGLVNGVCLVVLAFLIPALPWSPGVSIPLVVAFVACGANALWLRRRFWWALEREMERSQG